MNGIHGRNVIHMIKNVIHMIKNGIQMIKNFIHMIRNVTHGIRNFIYMIRKAIHWIRNFRYATHKLKHFDTLGETFLSNNLVEAQILLFLPDCKKNCQRFSNLNKKSSPNGRLNVLTKLFLSKLFLSNSDLATSLLFGRVTCTTNQPR